MTAGFSRENKVAPACDDQAASYDRWYATPLGQLVDRVEKEAIFALLPELAGRRVLEVGCGTGNISLALARRGARVVGVDLSAPMLAAAAQRARQQGVPLAWIRGGAGSLPFPKNSFDGVISVLALDFISDRPGVVREMMRVLSPGGFLLLAMLNRYSLWTLKRILRAWFAPSLWRGVRFIAPGEFKLLLAGHPNLVEIRRRQAVYFPPWAHPSLLQHYPALERLGCGLQLPFGAFLVAVAQKRAS
jgi:ubiquinone/menaquinone biosynthesis C-methylase UbiE